MGVVTPGQGGASWLSDPTGRFDQRYWDGGAWTTAVMQGGEVLSDSEALPEGEPGSSVTPPVPVPLVPPPAAGPGHVPQAAAGDRYTSLGPDDAKRHLGPMLEMQGWSVSVAGPHQFDLAFSTRGKPNILIGILLLFLWIVPGVIYFIVKSRTKVLRASMIFVPTASGTRIALQGGNDAVQRLGPIMVMLPW